MKHALMVWGGWDGHEPQQCVERFAPWLAEQGCQVTTVNSLDPFADASLMRAIDLVVMSWTMAKPTPAQEQGLLTAIQHGAGYVTWHGGIDTFYGSKAYSFMIGAQWVDHPGGIVDYEVCPTGYFAVGLQPFKVKSEQYYMHLDPTNE